MDACRTIWKTDAVRSLWNLRLADEVLIVSFLQGKSASLPLCNFMSFLLSICRCVCFFVHCLHINQASLLIVGKGREIIVPVHHKICSSSCFT